MGLRATPNGRSRTLRRVAGEHDKPSRNEPDGVPVTETRGSCRPDRPDAPGVVTCCRLGARGIPQPLLMGGSDLYKQLVRERRTAAKRPSNPLRYRRSGHRRGVTAIQGTGGGDDYQDERWCATRQWIFGAHHGLSMIDLPSGARIPIAKILPHETVGRRLLIHRRGPADTTFHSGVGTSGAQRAHRQYGRAPRPRCAATAAT